MHTARGAGTHGRHRFAQHRRRGRAGRWLAVGTTTVVGWGALAVGSVFAWGYGPLLVVAGALGVVGIRRRTPAAESGLDPKLVMALVAVAGAAGLQLLPLPRPLLRLMSPARARVTEALGADGATAVTLTAGRAGGEGLGGTISVDPLATLFALACGLAMGFLLVGTARALSRSGVRRVARGVAGVGLVVALVGIVQHAVSPNAIYGLWEFPGESPYGPFFNKNHFAGWMLMAMALTTSYLCAVVEHAGSDLAARGGGWRQTAWWLTSAEASGFGLLGCAVIVMGIAVAQTLSTAGMLCLVATVTLLGGRALYRATDWLRRALIAALLGVPLLVGLLIVGPETVARGFSRTTWMDANSRTPIWDQAVRIAADFPVTGTGLNTFQHVGALYPREDQGRIYDAAHSDYLQLAAEGGVLVGLPALVALALLVREIRRRFVDAEDTHTTRWLRVGAVVGLLGLAVQEIVEYSLQVPANAALFTVLVAVAIHRPEPDHSAHERPVRAGRARVEAPALGELRIDSGMNGEHGTDGPGSRLGLETRKPSGHTFEFLDRDQRA